MRDYPEALHPYLKLAAAGDWCRPLTEYIRQRPTDEVRSVLYEAEAQRTSLGFILFNPQKTLDSYYLGRVAGLCRRRLSA